MQVYFHGFADVKANRSKRGPQLRCTGALPVRRDRPVAYGAKKHWPSAPARI